MAGMAEWKAKISLDLDELRKQLQNAEDRLNKFGESDRKIKLNIDETVLDSAIKRLDKMLESLGKGTGDFKQFETLSKEISDMVSSVKDLSSAFGKLDGSGAQTLLSSIQNIDKSISSLNEHLQKTKIDFSKISNEDQFSNDKKSAENLINLFEKVESHLSSIKKVFSDVGDGEEFSPLLQTIKNVESAIDSLSQATKGIGFNMNIDVGSNKELEQQLESKVSNALSAYERLFEHIKMSNAGDSYMMNNFFAFDINQFDTMMAKVQAYRTFIENQRKDYEARTGHSGAYDKTDKKYWTQASSAMGQITKIQNEIKASKDGSSLENLFGKTDLTEVISSLNQIVVKLDEIVNSAKDLKTAFADGLKIESATADVTELTNKVKALEEELSKLKSGTPSDTTSSNSGTKTSTKTKSVDPAKELDNAWKEANRINNALNYTKQLMEGLSQNEALSVEFTELGQKIEDSNNKLKTSQYTVAEYNKFVKSAVSEYKNLDKAQQQSVAEANTKAYTEQIAVIEKLTKARTDLNAAQKNNKNGSRDSEIADLNAQIAELEPKAKKAEQAIEKMYNPTDGSQATITAEQYASALEKIKESATGSAKSVNDLAAAQKAALQSQISGYESDVSRWDKIVHDRETKPETGSQSSTYQNNLTAMKAAYHEMHDLQVKMSEAAKQGIGPSKEDVKRFGELKTKLEGCEQSFKDLTAAQKGSTSLSRDKLFNKIGDYLHKNSGMAKEFKVQLEALQKELTLRGADANVSDLTDKFLKLQIAIREAGQEGRTFLDVVKDKAWYGLAGQIATYFSFQDIIRYGKEAAQTVVQLNTNITELSKVSDATSKQIYSDFKSYADIAKELGGTISDTISATADWSRNGYNIPDSKELARVALLYKNVGDGISIDEANESLISTLRGFRLEAEDALHIIDVFNNVSNNEPIDSAGIGDALQRSAAAFNAANTSLEKSVALISATNSVLQDPEKVGNMWRTVSARIRGAKLELEEAGLDTEGMVESTSKLRDIIKGLTGFDIMKNENEYKDIYDIVVGIGEKWNDLTDIQRAGLLEQLAGKQQSNALAAALSNIDILKKSYGEASDAAGSAMEEQSKYEASVQYSIDRSKASLEQLANTLISSDSLKGLIDAGNTILDIINAIANKAGLITPVATAFAAVLSTQNVGRGKMYPLMFEYADNNMCSLGY